MDLSLKYRPKNFEEVVGQEYIVRSIKNAIKYNDIAPLYLFSGPKGTGKTSIARLIAMSLSCNNINDGNSCGTCKNCKSILEGKYFVDVNEINTAQYTKKGDADSLILDTINYQPMISDKKIYILDECHQLSKSAQQSLLKVFEEPPDNVIFILCTTEVDKVLATISDRALHYNFKPIPIKLIRKKLEDICHNERIEIDQDAIDLIAKKSSGSMRKPFKILSTIGINEKITLQDVENVVGQSDIEAAKKYLYITVGLQDRSEASKFVEDLINNGKNFENILLEAMEFLIILLKYKMGDNACIIENEPLVEILGPPSQIFNVLNLLEGGIKRINNSYAPENIIATIITLEIIGSLKENINK